MSATRAVIGLGSNLAHPRRRIARALREIARIPATRLTRVSPNYLTAPVDPGEPQPDYVNAVAMVSTRLAPRALLSRLRAIERHAGRRRDARARNLARTLDLDLLLYGARRMDTVALTLPHPRMHARAFVLRPLIDVAPAVVIPRRGLARRLVRAVADQRIKRTRSPALPPRGAIGRARA